MHVSAEQTASGTTTGSGTIVQEPSFEEQTALLELLLNERSIKNRDELAEDAEKRTTFLEDREEHWKALAVLREKCRADVRKSNRDTKLSVTLSCYRADLTLQMEFLRKEKTYLNALGGLSKTGRMRIESAIDGLSEAMATVVNAIDSDVYERAEDVLTAKQKLGTQYRQQHYLAWEIARADRMLGWVGLFAQRIRQMSAQPDTSETTLLKMRESMVCLQKNAAILKSAMTVKNYAETNAFFGQYQSGLTNCVESLRSVLRSVRGIPDPVKDSPSGAENASAGTGSITK